MSKKNVQFVSEIQSSSDAIRFFRIKKEQGYPIEIEKVGEVQYKIEVPGKGQIHLNENCRVLPKAQRSLIGLWIFCLLGITAAVGIAIFLLNSA